jgi:hypothetical protein
LVLFEKKKQRSPYSTTTMIAGTHVDVLFSFNWNYYYNVGIEGNSVLQRHDDILHHSQHLRDKSPQEHLEARLQAT